MRRRLRQEQFGSEDRDLLAEAAGHPCLTEAKDLTARTVAEIAVDRGIDFATALVYDRLLRIPSNRKFVEDASGNARMAISGNTCFAVVPGAFHKHHTHTGADGNRIVRMLRKGGGRVEVINVESFGRVRRNAEIVAEWLEGRRKERIVVVSLSKGSAEVKAAFRNHPELAENVLGWVSLSGIVNGTPLVNWLEGQPWRLWGIRFLLWMRGLPFAAVHDLRHDPEGLLAKWGERAEELPVVHINAVPLYRHLRHPWAPKAYRRLKELGPNDGGGILLGELPQLPGIVYPVWGADHYLDPAWDCEGLLSNVLALASTGALRSRQASLCEM